MAISLPNRLFLIVEFHQLFSCTASFLPEWLFALATHTHTPRPPLFDQGAAAAASSLGDGTAGAAASPKSVEHSTSTRSASVPKLVRARSRCDDVIRRGAAVYNNIIIKNTSPFVNMQSSQSFIKSMHAVSLSLLLSTHSPSPNRPTRAFAHSLKPNAY